MPHSGHSPAGMISPMSTRSSRSGVFSLAHLVELPRHTVQIVSNEAARRPLNWGENVHDCTSIHTDGPVSDVFSLFSLFQELMRMPLSEPRHIGVRLEGTVFGFTIVKHDPPMDESPA